MKKKYVNDYVKISDEARPGKRESWKYVGPYYAFSGEAADILRCKRLILAAALLSLGVFIVLGLCDTRGLRTLYVALPYVAQFMPMVLAIGDAFQLLRAPARMERQAYDLAVVQLENCTRAVLVIAAVTLTGALLALVLSQTSLAEEALFLAGEAAVLLLMRASLGFQKQHPCAVVENGAQAR